MCSASLCNDFISRALICFALRCFAATALTDTTKESIAFVCVALLCGHGAHRAHAGFCCVAVMCADVSCCAVLFGAVICIVLNCRCWCAMPCFASRSRNAQDSQGLTEEVGCFGLPRCAVIIAFLCFAVTAAPWTSVALLSVTFLCFDVLYFAVLRCALQCSPCLASLCFVFAFTN